MEKAHNIWARAGVSFSLTNDEANIVLGCNGNSEAIAQIMRNVVNEGRFNFEGDSYIPADCISEFNRTHGTAFDDDCEPEWDF